MKFPRTLLDSLRAVSRFGNSLVLGLILLVGAAQRAPAGEAAPAHFEVLQQSLSGLTVRMDLPLQKGDPGQRRRALVAIGEGPPPEIRIREFSFATWSKSATEPLSQAGPITVEATAEKLGEIAEVRRIAQILPLGVVRNLRLATLQVQPYHRVRRSAEKVNQITSLTLELSFREEGRPAAPEAAFNRGFPSGFRGIFDQLVLNVEGAPQVCEAVAPDLEEEENPPYFSVPSLKLSTAEEGFYFLSGAELKALASGPVLPGDPALYQKKQPVPLAVLRAGAGGLHLDDRVDQPLADDDGILFFAPGSTSPYSPTSVFFLTLTGGGPQCQVLAPALSGENPTAATSARVRLHFEENHLLWPKKAEVKDKDQHSFWIWQAVSADEGFSQRFDLPSPPTPDGGGVRIRLTLLPDNNVRAFQPAGYTFHIGDATYGGGGLRPRKVPGDPYRATLDFTLASNRLNPEHPALDFSIQGKEPDAARAPQGFSIDAVDIEYESTLVLSREKPLEFTPRPRERAWRLQCAPEVRLETATAIAWNATGQLLSLPVQADGKGLRLSIPTAGDEDNGIEKISVFTSAGALLAPEWEPSFPTRLRQVPRRADLIVITHPVVRREIQPLVNLRRKQGYAVEVVSAPDIYKYFGDGSLNPENLKAFLRHAYRHWQPPAPTYVLLVGEARWDYYGHLGADVPNLVPSYHVVPAYSSDNWYACICGDDALPDYLISRLSVGDATDARTVVEKIVEYETDCEPGPWQGRLLLISGTEKTFEDETEEQIQQWLPAYLNTTYLRVRDFPFMDDFSAPEKKRLEKQLKHSKACNEALLEHLERGQLLWQFLGHGSPNVFTPQRIFFAGKTPNSHVKRMRNRPSLPVLVALTCDTIQFDYSGEKGPKWTLCVGEELLTHPDGGAVAVYGATGRGYPEHHVMLNRGFYDALFHYGFHTLGEAMTVSKLLAYSEEPTDEPLNMFGLLGDGLTAMPLPGETVPVEVRAEAPLETQREGRLKVEMDLRGFSAERLRSQEARIVVQDAACRVLFEKREQRLRPKRWKYTVSVPPTVQEGRGWAGVFLYPKTGERLEEAGYLDGGAFFHVAPRAIPEGFPENASPDLVLTAEAIHFSPEDPRNGETVFIDVEVVNQGNAPARNVVAQAYNKPPEQGGRRLDDLANWSLPSLPALLPGETGRLRLRWDPWLNAGPHELFVKIDPRNVIAESDEGNNSATAAIYVLKKIDLALELEDFRLERSDSEEGYQLQAAVRNIGETISEPCMIEIALHDRTQSEEPAEVLLVELSRRIPPVRINPETGGKGGGRARFTIPLPLSTVWLEMTVDPEEILHEETHQNNRITLQVSDLLSAGTRSP